MKEFLSNRTSTEGSGNRFSTVTRTYLHMTSPLAATLDVHIANIKSLTSMPRSSAIVITSVVSSILEPLVLSSVSTDLKLKSKGFKKLGWTVVKIRHEDIRFEFSHPMYKEK